jgi:hypothetical protein
MPSPGYLRSHTARLAATILTAAICVISAKCQTGSSEPPTECSPYASIPLPPEAEQAVTPKTAPACASYRSYRGIGRPVNYAEARACAWQERLAQQAGLQQNPQELTAWVVGGSLILADIYFNGAGVPRNVPLAIRFACEAEEGMATLALPELQKFSDVARAHEPFEFCDYAASTITMSFCSGYESEVDDDRKDRYYKSLKATMTPEQQRAFEKLIVTQKAYVKAHASEVDQSGTIRDIRTIGSESILSNLFHAEVVHFERGKWPALSDTQIAAADIVLHREYARALRRARIQPQGMIDMGAVSAAHLSSVEKPWEAYRDAWVAFARLRYPDAAARIRAQITLDRYRLLKTISPDTGL